MVLSTPGSFVKIVITIFFYGDNKETAENATEFVGKQSIVHKSNIMTEVYEMHSTTPFSRTKTRKLMQIIAQEPLPTPTLCQSVSRSPSSCSQIAHIPRNNVTTLRKRVQFRITASKGRHFSHGRKYLPNFAIYTFIAYTTVTLTQLSTLIFHYTLSTLSPTETVMTDK